MNFNLTFANKLRLFLGAIFLLLALLTFSTANIISNFEKTVNVKENLIDFIENSKKNAKTLTDLWKPGEKVEKKEN